MKKHKKASKSSRKTTSTRATRSTTHPEHRERVQRAKRALRALRHPVFFPKAVIHTNKMRIPAELMEEIPEQALIEHWEAIGELKRKGIEVRATHVQDIHPHLSRTIELDAPISVHARQFAMRHGLTIAERKNPWRTTLERVFG